MAGSQGGGEGLAEEAPRPHQPGPDGSLGDSEERRDLGGVELFEGGKLDGVPEVVREGGDGPPEERLSYQDPVPHQKRFLLRAYERGVVVGLGSDTPFPHLVPGFSLHDELTMYVDAGIRPVDALRSATSINARVLGMESRAGRLAAGLTADMMAVRGNPLSCIDDVSQIIHVIRMGCLLDRQELLHAVQATFAEQPDDAITRDLLDYAHHRLKTQ